MSQQVEPLTGCVIVITSDRRKRELAAALERRGATIAHAHAHSHALSTVPHIDDAHLIADARELVARPPDMVVATTGIGCREWIEAAGVTVSYPTRWRLGALVRELVKHFSENTVGIPTPEGTLVMRATTAVLNGRVLPLTPTGLEILRALAGAGGNVVTREDLADLLPGGQASNHAVDAAINRLRENAQSRALVRTVVKRGYALEVSVS